MSNSNEDTGEVVDKVKSLANEAGVRCHSACDRAKEIVTKNPVPTVLGVLVFGAAVGYLLYSRRDASFYDRLVSEADHARRRLRSAPSRLSSLLNDGIGSASRHAHRASDYIHDLPADDMIDSVSNSINRLRNRLKFW